MMKKNNKLLKILTIILMLILLAITLYNVYIMYENIEIYSNYEATRTSFSTEYDQDVENNSESKQNVADMLEDVIDSVVGISKLKTAGNSILGTAAEDQLGLGTGIIVSENGYILSNSHVTGEKYSTCYVTLEDGNTYKGDVVWADSDLDLSITKIKASNFKYAVLGDSRSIRIGESAYAIGNPIGYEFRRTVTSGIISALNRTIKVEENNRSIYMSDLIQTDATINPGNSGGPLVNSNGEVIGVNTVKITSAEGIGFAIPINVIKPIIESFVKIGKFEEAILGVYVYDEDIAQYLLLESDITDGIYVSEVMENGPANSADLKAGDIITSIDNVKLKTINDLREYIYTKQPGDSVTLNILRGKITKDIAVTLGKSQNKF